MIKYSILFLLLNILVFGCDAEVAEPESNLTPLDVKCLLSSQWGVDYNYPTPKFEKDWFTTPRLNFNSSEEGFMTVGIQPNTFRNNDISLIVEIPFKYTINGGRIIFNIQSVRTYNAFLTKQNEFIGSEAVVYASELVNLKHLGNGQACECTAKSLSFIKADPATESPIQTNHWVRKNFTTYPN
ncbi:hypothetical protein SAMN06298216_2255 [Spirosomataceae bacterium TFI 002]|nr:hypothetical protein SAMN06298216_2255 [Spirosomataceae bacterium TFI 002]